MQRQDTLITSVCDYILAQDRQLFLNTQIREPRGFSSDHYALRASIRTAPLRINRQYLKGHKRFPLVPPQRTQADLQFAQLKAAKTPATRYT